MSSRFTETDKWKDRWFRKLSVESKLFFEYIRDNCDIAGFWEIDLEKASFETNLPLAQQTEIFDSCKNPHKSLVECLEELKKSYLREGDVIWVRMFLYHQKNLPLNPKNTFHKGILKLIKSRNPFGQKVLGEIDRIIQLKGLPSPHKEGMEECVRGNSNSNSNSNSKYSLQDCENACFQNGIPDKEAWEYFRHYGSQGWKKANGQPITNLALHMNERWDKAKQRWDFDEKKSSTKPAKVDKDGLTPRQKYLKDQGDPDWEKG